MNLLENKFLDAAATAAADSRHIFPQMAACEAALESDWGTSALARKDNNLFGMKQHRHPIFGTEVLPTREFENGEWKQTTALWIHYPGWATCFLDRMSTLVRLSRMYPNYDAALKAADATAYVTAVSKTWSTDPQRAAKVISIYNQSFATRGIGQ